MKTKIDIWKWLLPIWLLATSCIYDDLDCHETNKDDASSHPYVVLRIAVPSDGTRSNPTGGEEGDGREAGIGNEEKIHDINVFFYDHKDGLDAPDADATDMLFHLYYNEDPDDPNITELTHLNAEEKHDGVNLYCSSNYLELRFKLPGEYSKKLVDGVKFAAVANVGYIEGVSTIGDLTDLDLSDRINGKASLSTQADRMDYFPMSTAYNKEYTYGEKTTGDNRMRLVDDHLEGVTTIERLYARIDLWYKSDRLGDNDNCLSYEVLDEKDDTDTGNRVYVYNVLPINVMQTPSYLFKKVTDSPGDADITWDKEYLSALEDFKWGGKETPSVIPTSYPDDMPTNYVMERHTLLKSPGGTTGDLPAWYGNTKAEQVRSDITDSDKGKLNEYHSPEQQFVGNECDHVFIISYANENTHPSDCYHSNYLTGLAFRGLYVPAHIYSAYDAAAGLTELTNKTTLPTGGKIYRYSPSGGIDETATANTETEYKNPSEKYSLYFSNENAANTYKAAHPTENGILTAFTAQVNDTYGLGFVCYYNLWLRHYNDESDDADPQQTYPMEYATVRNNIYRVSIGFTGPGDPEPEMREPDTMMSRIFVRKWNLREESNPLQF